MSSETPKFPSRTTETEDFIRNLEFKPGIPMSAIISHDAVKVIAKAFDDESPISVDPGDIFHDLLTDRHYIVQVVDKNTVHMVHIALAGKVIPVTFSLLDVGERIRNKSLLFKSPDH